MRKNEETQSAQMIRFMSSVLLGGVLALVICLVFVFFCSIGIASGWLNEHLMLQYTIAGCALGSLIGGLFAVKRFQAKTLLVGLSIGVLIFLFLLIAGMLLYTGVSVESHGFGLACACLVGGVLAGFLGGKQKKKRRR